MSKVIDLQAQLEQARKELDGKEAALGEAILKGGDAGKLTSDIAQLKARSVGLAAAVEAAARQEKVNRDNATAAQRAADKKREFDLRAQLPAEKERVLRTLRGMKEEIDLIAQEYDAAAQKAGVMPGGDIGALISIEQEISKILARFNLVAAMQSAQSKR